jgi:hypothetical protein
MSNDPSRPTDPEKIIGKNSKQAHEATEIDLWDLDSIDSDLVKPVPSRPSEPSGLPARRKTGSSTFQSRKPTERHLNTPAMEAIKSMEQLAAKSEEKPAPAPEPEATLEPPKEDSQTSEETGEAKQNPDVTDMATVSPGMLPTIATFSKVEKIAVSCLFAVLALGATLTLIHFSNRVPTRPLVAKKIDYPVVGEIVEIKAASTYWRTPVTTGENTDVVRRGTQLIPVVKLSLSGTGVIRVFFRNEHDILIGDGITRSVKGDTEITVAATAGFEDVGMHTAYRTSDSLPWVVQVFEAPTATAPREKFRKVLETEISTMIR